MWTLIQLLAENGIKGADAGTALRNVLLKISAPDALPKEAQKSLKDLGMDLKPVFCGGIKDPWVQEREQWHSGANFFAIGPGKVIGYGRNEYTINELNIHGFDILKAQDVIQNKVNLKDYEKYVITIEGSELARGGGGARCMTMPVSRKAVDW